MAVTMQQTPDVSGASGGNIDFRRATVERTEQLAAITTAMTTSSQRIENEVVGSGYMYALVLDTVIVSKSNTAAVQFVEDAPWSHWDTVTLRDVNAESVNCQGFDLFIGDLMQKQYAKDWLDKSAEIFTTVGGNVANGGSYTFMVEIPVGLNRRSLSGILGNQNRAQSYFLRSDLAASTSVYATSPTNLPGATSTINTSVTYENYAVPLAQNPEGASQEREPADFGLYHYLTAMRSSEAPVPSSQVQHFLKRVGYTVRGLGFIFRAGTGTTPRNVAQSNVPTDIQLRIGDAIVFHDIWRYRRAKMFTRFGLDFPDGVLVYDFIHDFLVGAGNEIGDDYLQTQGLVNSYLQCTYPSGFTSGGSLRIVTDDLAFVPPVRT